MTIQTKTKVFSAIAIFLAVIAVPYTVFADDSYISNSISSLDAINDWNHSFGNPFDVSQTNNYSTPMYASTGYTSYGTNNCCNSNSYSTYGLKYSYNLPQYPAGYGATNYSSYSYVPVSRYSYNISQYPAGHSADSDNSGNYFFNPVPRYNYTESQYPAGTGAAITGAGAQVPGYTARTESYPAGGGASNNDYGRVPGFSSYTSQYGNNYYYSNAPIPGYSSNYTSTGFNTNTNNNNNNGGGFIISGNSNNYGPGSFVITSSH